MVLPSDLDAARIEAVGGVEQVGSAGLPLEDSLVARVTDAEGEPVPDVAVAFELEDGAAGGDLSPDTALTDALGLARTSWTPGGGAGAQAVIARVVGAALTVRFTASTGSSDADRIEAVSGEDQSAPVGTALADSLIVRVLDEMGEPVPGVSVSWTASAGEVSPTSATTDAQGMAAARRILGARTGSQSAEARVPGIDGSPVVFTHTATPGTATSLVLISGSEQTGSPDEELDDPLVVRLVDRAGNGISGRAVTWVVATGGGSVTPETSTTDRDGLASAEWTLGPSTGPNTVSAVVSGVGIVTFTATAVGGGGGGGDPSAARSTVSADPTSIQTVSGTSTIRVTVRNGAGAPVAGATVSLSVSGRGNTVIQPSAPTGADGIALGTLSSTVPGTKEVTATVNGSVRINQTAQVSVAAAPATRIELVEGADQSAAAGAQVPVPPAVRVTDATGQPVSGVEVNFVVTGGGGSVTGASQTTNSAGIARVGGWRLGSPGLNTLEARAGSLAGSPVVFRATASQSAAEPHHFVFRVQPRDVGVNEPFSVEVAIVDIGGNLVPLSGIEIYLGLFRRGDDNPTNRRLQGERNQDTRNGIAVFDGLRVTEVEDGYRLRALSDDLPELGPHGPEPFLFSQPFDVE